MYPAGAQGARDRAGQTGHVTHRSGAILLAGLLAGALAPSAAEGAGAVTVGAGAEPTAVPERVAIRSGALRNGDLRSPMPGGFVGGWSGDTGLDIMGSPRPVFALAAGTLDYSEQGHTRWVRGRDTPNSVRFALDTPIAFQKHTITHVYYTHLSKLASVQHEGDSPRKHVEAGELLGMSGVGNGVMHLHVGLLLDGNVAQDSWETLLVEGDIRKVMGGYKNGESLPTM